MKIIGRGPSNTSIVEVTSDEMAQLCGYPNSNSPEYQILTKGGPLLPLGATVNVSDAFMSLWRRRGHQKDIDRIVEGLEAVIKDIRVIDPAQDIGDVQ